MKKFLGVFTFLIFMFNSSLIYAEIKNQPQGFRSFKWFDPLFEDADVEFVFDSATKGNVKEFYTIKDDDLSFEGFVFEKIVYAFESGLFFGVGLHGSDQELYNGIEEYMIARYGSDFSRKEGNMYWPNEEMSIMLSKNYISNKVYIGIHLNNQAIRNYQIESRKENVAK